MGQFKFSLIGFFLLQFSTLLFAQAESIDVHDFSSVDFSPKRIIKLDTVWTLHWNQIITPQEQLPVQVNNVRLRDGITAWTDLTLNSSKLPSYGYATYNTTIVLPSDAPSLALKIPKVYSSCRVWVNDEIVFRAGQVGKSKKETKHARIGAVIPLSNKTDTLHLLINVANYYHRLGGIDNPIIMGTTEFLWKRERGKIQSDMTLIGSLMFIGISFLILYYLFWNKDKAILYFSIFCLSWGYRSLSDGYAPLPSAFEWFPWVLHVKLEYASMFFGGLMGILFLNTIFKNYFHHLYPKINTWFIWSLIILDLFLPNTYFTYLLIPFFLLATLNVIYVIIILVQVPKGESHPLLALAGVFSALAVLSYHMFSFNFLRDENDLIISVGYILVFMINSLLLGKRFSVSFGSLKKLQEETFYQKQEISNQAKLLNKINDGLEEKVKERTHELQKVVIDLKDRNINLEQFNYIISHNMRAPVANITGLLNLYNHENPSDPFNKKALSKLETSCKQLDEVLKDLTDILEIKRHINRPSENIIFADLMSKILNLIQKDIEKSYVQFETDFEVESIQSTPSFWHSVFINLISNSIKYRAPDKACLIKITSKKVDDKIVLTFEDNGIGINLKENGGNIFGLYKRFHHHVDGRGMGLFMVKTQIESIGGNIQVESQPGTGSKFIVSISSDS